MTNTENFFEYLEAQYVESRQAEYVDTVGTVEAERTRDYLASFVEFCKDYFRKDVIISTVMPPEGLYLELDSKIELFIESRLHKDLPAKSIMEPSVDIPIGTKS